MPEKKKTATAKYVAGQEMNVPAIRVGKKKQKNDYCWRK